MPFRRAALERATADPAWRCTLVFGDSCHVPSPFSGAVDPGCLASADSVLGASLRSKVFFSFDHVRYGAYSVIMLTIMAGAYFLDQQSRLQSFSQVMSLQDKNAALA